MSVQPTTKIEGPAVSVRSGAIVLLVPRVGDEWEFQLPGKSKRRKIVASISHEWHRGKWCFEACRHSETMHPRVNWKRQSKGRYTSLRVKWLLKYGRRLSTEAERNAKINARMAALDRQNVPDQPRSP